jgi:DNA topoisomerase-1
MAPSKIETTTIRLINNKNKFYTNSSKIIFDGYRIVEKDENVEQKRGLDINKYNLHSKHQAKEIKVLKHDAPPPPRYTQATLIKALEDSGIGRPSTYKQMAMVALDRGYVEALGRSFKLNDRGEIIIDNLKKFFPEVVDISLTKQMEEHLDAISNNNEK